MLGLSCSLLVAVLALAKAVEIGNIAKCQTGKADLAGDTKVFTVQVCNLFGATCYVNQVETTSADCAENALMIESQQCALFPIMSYQGNDRSDPANIKEYKAKPTAISKSAADVVPQADYVIVALPSFAIKNVLTGIKDHLKDGATVYIMPGQGSPDVVARDVLGDLIKADKTTVAGIIPMPLNCRITEWGKRVELAAFKASYDLASIPAKNAELAAEGLRSLLPGK